MTEAPRRILTLDVIRGVAVMGILLLNIVGFGLIDAAYVNPRAQGGDSGVDLATYLVSFILFDGKMRGLFTMLFGASLILVTDRAEAAGASPALTHYSRMVWLLVFGLIHLWFVFPNDILTHYALVGMIAYGARDMRMPAQLFAGCVLILIGAAIAAGLPFGVWAASQGMAPGSTPNADPAELRALFDGIFGRPSDAAVAREMAEHLGGYRAMMAAEFSDTAWLPLASLFDTGPETLGYLLLGMAAYRSGLLTGGWSQESYRRWALAGLGMGIVGYSALAAYLVASDFSTFSVALGVMTLPEVVRPAMTIGWACLIILLIRPDGAITTRVAAVGRMAFSNYLLTSIVMTTIFAGFGFGLFGRLSRAQLYIAVAGMWMAMLIWSQPWLARFGQGPFEALWRRLARGERQSRGRTAIATSPQ